MRPLRHVHVMADYGAFPLWERSRDRAPGDIDPATLPLTTELRTALLAWAREYDERAPREAAPHGDSRSPREWHRRGRYLTREVRRQLRGVPRVTSHIA